MAPTYAVPGLFQHYRIFQDLRLFGTMRFLSDSIVSEAPSIFITKPKVLQA